MKKMPNVKSSLVIKYQLFKRSEDGLLKHYDGNEYKSYDTPEEALKMLNYYDENVLIIPITKIEYDY